MDIIYKRGEKMQDEKWISRSAKIFFALAVLLAVYIVLKYAIEIIFPFLAAFIISLPIVKLSSFAARRLGGSQKSWGVFLALIFWLFLFVLIFAAIRRLLLQTEELFLFFGDHIVQISESAEKIYNAAMDIPLFGSLLGGEGTAGNEWLPPLLEKISVKGSEAAASAVAKMLTFTPRFAIGLVVCMISSFYFCKDWEKIKKFAIKIIPMGTKENAQKIARGVYDGIRSYLKAYLWLFLITFCELFWKGKPSHHCLNEYRSSLIQCQLHAFL
jgi:predicted PurR-regulated permease PerM